MACKLAIKKLKTFGNQQRVQSVQYIGGNNVALSFILHSVTAHQFQSFHESATLANSSNFPIRSSNIHSFLHIFKSVNLKNQY